MSAEAHSKNHNAAGHETRDVAPRPVALFGLALGGLVVFAMLVMWGVFYFLQARYEASQPPPRPLAETLPSLPPEPRLQPNPGIDLKQLRRTEDGRLNSYGWVDRSAGTAHIPVDRAMEIVAQKGLPARKEVGK